MRDLAGGIAQIKGRWMIGGSALGQAPADWQAIASRDAEPELALLAIASQATQLVHRPTPGNAAQPAKRLPWLGKALCRA